MPPKQTREERLEKKRQAERRRLEKIRNDPILRAQRQEMERQKYLNKKRKGIIVPISEMSPRQQQIMRKRNRESTNRHYQKKKLQKLKESEEHEIIEDKKNSDMNGVIEDPLRSTSPHSSNNLGIKSPAPMSADSDISTSYNRFTRPVRRNIIKYKIQGQRKDQHSLKSEPIVHGDSLTSSPESSLDENNFTSASESDKLSSIERKQESDHISAKSKSSWEYLLRKIKYRFRKELQIKDQQIQELKRTIEKYRKELQRLKIRNREGNVVESHSETRKNQEKYENKPQVLCVGSSKTRLKKEIESCFEEDENSRIGSE